MLANVIYYCQVGISASLAPPPLDENLAVRERLEKLQACLAKPSSGGDGGMIAYDFIQFYKALLLACGLAIRGTFEDPKVCESATDAAFDGHLMM